MPDIPKPDLSEHEEEAVPFDDVLRRLLEAKPAPKINKEPNSMTNDQDANCDDR
jgi:hypothetical protein